MYVRLELKCLLFRSQSSTVNPSKTLKSGRRKNENHKTLESESLRFKSCTGTSKSDHLGIF